MRDARGGDFSTPKPKPPLLASCSEPRIENESFFAPCHSS